MQAGQMPERTWEVGSARRSGLENTAAPRSEPSVLGRLYDVAASSAHNVWAVGLSGADPLVLHFTGAQWVEDLMPAGATFLYGVSAPSRSDVWADGGSNWWSPSNTVAYHWDGAAWTRVQTPTPDGDADFTAVAATSARSAWGVGLTGPGGPGVTGHYVPIIEHWNGHGWRRIPAPPGLVDLQSVTVLSRNDARPSAF
jgi:hypothetical protein